MNPGSHTAFLTGHKKRFYNRQQIIPLLGIDSLYQDTDMNCTTEGGSWGSRTEECVVSEAITLMNSSDAPDLLLIEGAQNHAVYNVAYNKIPYQFSDAIPLKDRAALLIHINHLHDQAEQLVRLTQFIKDSKEPTVLLAFGDHLPPSFSFLPSKRDTVEHPNATPYILFSNFSLPSDALNLISELEYPATYELNAVLQLTAGLPLSPAGRASLVWRKDCPASAVEKMESECIRRHQLLSYDLILGKKFANNL
jgi:hypothetical protein